jgi:cytochrome c-type biogenesis protein CcmH/NrfG
VIHDDPRLSACPPDATLASFYAGELAEHEEDALRDHLVSCPACTERARDAATFVEAMKEDAREAPRGRRIGRVPVWAVAMAATLVAAAILFIWRTAAPPPPAASTEVASASPAPGPPMARAHRRELAVEPAPYVPDAAAGIVWRGGDQSATEPAEGSFAWAMAPYVQRDFPAAAGRLGRRLGDDPNDERARFYLGVSLLLAGRAEESVEPLRRVAERHDVLSGDASWYLAAACLETGDDAGAAALLRELAGRGGDRGMRARELLERIEAEPKR